MTKTVKYWFLSIATLFIAVLGWVLTVNKTQKSVNISDDIQQTSSIVPNGISKDELNQESVIDSIQADFPDIHFLFTDIINRTVTKTSNGYLMEATAKGMLEFVAYAHYEDLTEEGWILELSPDVNNLEAQEFIATKDGMRMYFLGQQINSEEVFFRLEVSK